MKNKVVVIGGGPGGYVSAIRLAQLGNDVTVIEKDKLGGVCLNVGCIPSKALLDVSQEYFSLNTNANMKGIISKNTDIDFSKSIKWKNDLVVKPLVSGIESLLNKNKIKLIKGEAKFKNTKELEIDIKGIKTTLKFDNAVIATGSRNIEVKSLEFNDDILDSTAALNMSKLPKSLLVVGSGFIGSELANIYANLGVEVTVIEGQSRITPGFDEDMSAVLSDYWTEELNIKVITNGKVQSYKKVDSKLRVSYIQGGSMKDVLVDKVLVSVGRIPNTDNLNLNSIGIQLEKNGLIKVDKHLQTTVKGIYAIGDIVPGLALAHKASYEGKYVADQISGDHWVYPQPKIPSVCYTNIELASVGLSNEDIKNEKNKYLISKVPWSSVGRSFATGSLKGFVRIIADKQTHQVLGAQIAGNGAGELISYLTLAIESQLLLEDISLTVFPHPSYSEAIMEVSDLGLGLPVHI